jgi:hypothetical protein
LKTAIGLFSTDLTVDLDNTATYAATEENIT